MLQPKEVVRSEGNPVVRKLPTSFRLGTKGVELLEWLARHLGVSQDRGSGDADPRERTMRKRSGARGCGSMAKTSLPDRILTVVAGQSGLTDREISDLLLGKDASEQPINFACRRLDARGLLELMPRLGSQGRRRVPSRHSPSKQALW